MLLIVAALQTINEARAQFVYSCPPGNGPANDCATSATLVVADGSPIAFDTSLATTDGPPQPYCGSPIGEEAIHKDVWWKFLSPATGTLVATNCWTGSFDSKIAAYDLGYDPSNFDPQNLPNGFIGCHEDCADPAFTSELNAPVQLGHYYLVRLGGFAGASGTGQVRISVIPSSNPPQNPNPCLAANLLTWSGGPVTVTTSYAYLPFNPIPLTCPSFTGPIYNARFIRVSVIRNGVVTVDNCQDGTAAGDTRMAVLSECGMASTIITCNDNGCGAYGRGSKLSFTATAGSTYFVAVGGAYATPATFRVRVSPPCPDAHSEPGAPPDCVCYWSDLTGNGVVDGADLGVLLASWGPRDVNFPQPDINVDGQVNGADIGYLLSVWGSCPN